MTKIRSNRLRCLFAIGAFIALTCAVVGTSQAGDSDGLGGYRFKIYDEDTPFQKPGGALAGGIQAGGDAQPIVKDTNHELRMSIVFIRLAIFQTLRIGGCTVRQDG